jgi:peptidoglycan/LPS O-acetylase OafA/YrhL
MFFELGDYTSRSAGISSRLAWKAVTHLGLWTYALYVWHEPILLSLRETAPRALTFVQSSQYLLVGVPLLLSVGWFFFRMVELPFDRLRDGGSSVTWFGRALP